MSSCGGQLRVQFRLKAGLQARVPVLRNGQLFRAESWIKLTPPIFLQRNGCIRESETNRQASRAETMYLVVPNAPSRVSL